MPLRMFSSRNVAGANLVQLLMVAGLFGMFFLGVLFMQHVLGYSAIGTGVAFLPLSLGIGVLSLGFSARLNFRFGPKATLLAGLGLLVVGLAWLTRVPVHASYAVDLLPVDAAARSRRGAVVPVADDAGDVRARRPRTPGSPRASSTRPSRSVARSDWRCWRLCRRPGPPTCSAAGVEPSPPR